MAYNDTVPIDDIVYPSIFFSFFFVDFAICSGNQPILRESVCDGVSQCSDGEDESPEMHCWSE